MDQDSTYCPGPMMAQSVKLRSLGRVLLHELFDDRFRVRRYFSSKSLRYDVASPQI